MKTIVVGVDRNAGTMLGPVRPRRGRTRTAWAAARRTPTGPRATPTPKAAARSMPTARAPSTPTLTAAARQHGWDGGTTHTNVAGGTTDGRVWRGRRSTPPPPAYSDAITRRIRRLARTRRTIRPLPCPTTHQVATTAAAAGRRRRGRWHGGRRSNGFGQHGRGHVECVCGGRGDRQREYRRGVFVGIRGGQRHRRSCRAVAAPVAGATTTTVTTTTTYAMGDELCRGAGGLDPGQQERHDVLPQRQHVVPARLRRQRRVLPRGSGALTDSAGVRALDA